MARRQSKAVRTTLYRMVDVADLRDAVRSKYIGADLFSDIDLTIESRPAVQVTGAMKSQRTKWAGRLSDLTGRPVDVGNETAAAVLLVRDGESTAWALTYGMGFQLLDQDHVDAGFGMRVAIRAATPDAIQSMTRTTLDHRSRTDRSSIPGGEALRSFGFTDLGELVSRVAADAELPGLVGGSEPVVVRAADALSVPLGKTAADLVTDLDAIAGALSLPPKPELATLDQLRRVKSGGRLAELNGHLREALIDRSEDRLALGWPHERIDENGTPSSHRFRGLRTVSGEQRDGTPDFETILDALIEKNASDPLDAAKSIKVQLFRDADGEEAMSPDIPALNWLFFEVDLDSTRYCYFDSKWYAVEHDYTTHLTRRIEELFSRPSAVELPEWRVVDQPDEAAYNEFAATEIGGVVLDRQLVRTPQHPSGFEAADIVSPAGDFIHVKHVPKSAAASHLLAQASVSTDAIRFEPEAAVATRRRISDAGGDPSWLGDRLQSVVLCMARERPVASDDLFTFTQVTLARLDAILGEAQIGLSVCPVRRVP